MNTDELDAIIEAGKRATPRPYRVAVTENEPGRFGKVLLAEEKPNGLSTVIADLVPGRRGANGDYLALAANHADKLAATLLRVRELLSELPLRIESTELACSELVVLRLKEARELAKILEG